MPKSKSPSAKEWLDIKPVFLKLYLDESKPLKEVQDVLATEYDFIASTKAYKTHITEWRAFKNYKASEKADLAKCNQLLRQNGGDPRNLSIRGKPVKWDRVKRHSRSQATRDTVPVPTRHSKSHLNEFLQTQPLLPMRFPYVDTDEQILHRTKTILLWEVHTNTSERNRLYDATLDLTITEYFRRARPLISHPQTTQAGWSMIRTACAMIEQAARLSPRRILDLLLEFYTAKRWKDHMSLVSSVMTFIRDLSTRILQSKHPLQQLLACIRTPASILPIASHITSISATVLRTYKGVISQRMWYYYGVDNITRMMDLGKLDQAMDQLKDIIHLPLLDLDLILFLQTRLQYKQEHFKQSIKTSFDGIGQAMELMSKSKTRTGSLHMTKVVLRFYKMITRALIRLKQFDASVLLREITFVTSSMVFGTFHRKTVSCLHDWQVMLGRLGRYDELYQTQACHGHPYANSNIATSEARIYTSKDDIIVILNSSLKLVKSLALTSCEENT